MSRKSGSTVKILGAPEWAKANAGGQATEQNLFTGASVLQRDGGYVRKGGGAGPSGKWYLVSQQ